MIVEVEEAHRRAMNVTMRIRDAYAQCEPIDTINNLKMERRIWDEIQVMENGNLGIDDAHGDDQKGFIAKELFDACLEGMFVTGEEYAVGVKGTGDADVELDLFDNLPGLSEYDGENESTPAVVQPVPKGEAAANEWFLPSGEKICLKLGPVNPTVLDGGLARQISTLFGLLYVRYVKGNSPNIVAAGST
jgi:hypothetical protein